MKPVLDHDWNLSVDEAVDLQARLAGLVIRRDVLGPIERIAGVDVAYSAAEDRMVGAVVVLDARTLQVVEEATAIEEISFPYVPGLFSFRELPVLVAALAKIQRAPDLIICDGQGVAHPRRCGLASHLGVLYDIPTIGCAKTLLVGEYREPPAERGAREFLVDRGEVVGAILRTQARVRPIFASTGHRVSLETACGQILRAAPRYRLPETTRAADSLVRSLLAGELP
jgi:deoxyribonuclease V